MSTTPQPLYRALAQLVQARLNCITASNHEWKEKHEAGIEALVEFLPSGSGIDNGVQIDLDKSTAEKLVFHFGFHHMNEAGYYTAWTQHTLTVTGSLSHGFNLKISGPNRNEIKDYLHETFGWNFRRNVAQHEIEPQEWAWREVQAQQAY